MHVNTDININGGKNTCCSKYAGITVLLNAVDCELRLNAVLIIVTETTEKSDFLYVSLECSL